MAQLERIMPPVIIQKWYDVVLWILPLITKFSKDKRYTLGGRLEGNGVITEPRPRTFLYTEHGHKLSFYID